MAFSSWAIISEDMNRHFDSADTIALLWLLAVFALVNLRVIVFISTKSS